MSTCKMLHRSSQLVRREELLSNTFAFNVMSSLCKNNFLQCSSRNVCKKACNTLVNGCRLRVSNSKVSLPCNLQTCCSILPYISKRSYGHNFMLSSLHHSSTSANNIGFSTCVNTQRLFHFSLCNVMKSTS